MTKYFKQGTECIKRIKLWNDQTVALWWVVITAAQLNSTKPELRFCTGSNSAHGMSEIHDGEVLWQWSQLEIRLNTFCRSTIPQKQFIIIIIIIIIRVQDKSSRFGISENADYEQKIKHQIERNSFKQLPQDPRKKSEMKVLLDREIA